MGLRERLRNRQRPYTTYLLRVDDTTDAERALVAARKTHARAQARHSGDSPEAAEVAEAKTALDAAQAALDGCYEQLVLTAMRSDEYELLLAAHPPRKGVKDDEQVHYNTETFPPALLAECVGGDLTPEEWQEALTDCSYGEKQELLIIVQALNVRGPASSIPKG